MNLRNALGFTPLLISIDLQPWEIAEALIENGADVNIANNQKMTPIMFASKNGNHEMSIFYWKKMQLSMPVIEEKIHPFFLQVLMVILMWSRPCWKRMQTST